MKTLLYKQLRLVCHPMTLIFCLFGIMVIIPNYPYTVIFFYVMLGLFFTFLNMREQKDLYYTALLPVPKRDAVKAGCLFTALIELLSLAVLVPCALLAVRLQPGKDNLVGLDPNLALFAAGFLLYAVFNAVFLPSFYANGYKVGVAFVKAIIPTTLAMIVFESGPSGPTRRSSDLPMFPASCGWTIWTRPRRCVCCRISSPLCCSTASARCLRSGGRRRSMKKLICDSNDRREPVVALLDHPVGRLRSLPLG